MSSIPTNFSSSSSSSHIHSEHPSRNPEDNWWRTISLNKVLSFIYWLFTTIIFPRSHSQGAEEGSRGVESGGVRRGVIQLQAAGGSGGTQVAGTVMGNQAVPIEAEPGTGSSSHVIGLIVPHVVGIWIVPTAMGIISCLIEVVVGTQKANSEQKLLIYLCSGLSLITAFLGIILFILSIVQWVNNSRRDFIIRSMSVVALGLTFVDICVLTTFLLIVEQSKAHE